MPVCSGASAMKRVLRVAGSAVVGWVLLRWPDSPARCLVCTVAFHECAQDVVPATPPTLPGHKMFRHYITVIWPRQSPVHIDVISLPAHRALTPRGGRGRSGGCGAEPQVGDALPVPPAGGSGRAREPQESSQPATETQHHHSGDPTPQPWTEFTLRTRAREEKRQNLWISGDFPDRLGTAGRAVGNRRVRSAPRQLLPHPADDVDVVAAYAADARPAPSAHGRGCS